MHTGHTHCLSLSSTEKANALLPSCVPWRASLQSKAACQGDHVPAAPRPSNTCPQVGADERVRFFLKTLQTLLSEEDQRGTKGSTP